MKLLAGSRGGRGRAALALCAVVALAASACTGDEEGGGESPAGTSTGIAQPSLGEIVETGWAQADGIGVAVAVVESTAATGGQVVSVDSEFLDAEGEVVATASGLGGFTAPGQTIAVVADKQLRKGVEIADVRSTVSVSNDAELSITDVDLGPVEGVDIAKDGPFYTGSFTVMNTSEVEFSFPDVAAVCRDEGGEIIGGGLDFANKIKPGGQATVTPTLVVRSAPAECTAYISLPLDE